MTCRYFYSTKVFIVFRLVDYLNGRQLRTNTELRLPGNERIGVDYELDHDPELENVPSPMSEKLCCF